MKLKTSFFNSTVLKKDITRFAPLWGLYTVFMLLFLFLIQGDSVEPARFACDAPYILMGMGIVNFVYAGLCAILLFGDLFASKMCNAVHAMPMRREGWFLTHLTAGILFCVGPNALGALVSCMILQEYCYLAFLWLGVMLCQFLFFFGAGAFSAQCAGNRLGAVAVYGLFNFLAVLAAFLVYTFYAPVLYGVMPNWEEICRCSPVVGFTMSQFVSVQYDNMNSNAEFIGFLPEDWRFLFVSLIIGLALLGAAVLLYRRRHMESAGDFIAVKTASPVFLVLYTLCVGAVLYFVADQIGTGAAYLFLVIGFAIGFFTGWMLLEKKVNIFRPKRFLGFAVLTLAFFLTIALTFLDPLGITRYVPEAEQVQSVRISPYSSDWYFENDGCVLKDPAEIESVIQIHTQLVEDRNVQGDGILRLRYEMKNGTVVDRKYDLDVDSPEGQELKRLYSTMEGIFRTDDPEGFLKNVYRLEFHSYQTTLPYIAAATEYGRVLMDMDDLTDKFGEETETLQLMLEDSFDKDPLTVGLIEAIRKDCEAGVMAPLWEYHQGQDACGALIFEGLDIGEESGHIYKGSRVVEITIYPDCTNTVQYLKSLSE